MKQRVLIVNKFYYRLGGDCVCALNLEHLLRDNGHEVAVFAMRHPENLPSEWDTYWPDEISFSGGAKAKLSALKRTLGLGDVVAKFNRLLDDFHPDVVHLHNIHSYLSPIVAAIAHKRGIRVVWTMHDYKLICPSYSCLRNGKVCELCYTAPRNVLTTRCMKGSLAASAIAYMEALRWNRSRLQSYTDRFIAPSAFMASKMKQGGFPEEKISTLCNFISPDLLDSYSDTGINNGGDYYCYVGRLSEEKGVRTLLAAAASMPYTLKVAGGGPLADELKAQYSDYRNIEFLGMLGGEEVRDLLSHARFSILTSEWYENNPMGIIESLCAGCPVAGAEIGGIPELITPECGRTFRSGDKESLQQTVAEMWDTEFDRQAIKTKALADFAPETHYRKLMEIYSPER